MRKERIKTKRGFRGLGMFIFGWFIGFICTVLLIAGVGYWAYSSISVKKLEKWMKTDITSNKGLEELTLKKTINIVLGIAKSDTNAYSIAKLEEDFGVTLLDENNSPFGIDMSIIKNSPIKEIKTALDDTIDTITFVNVLSAMNAGEDLGLLDVVLDGEVKYYVSGGKMYTAGDYNTEVDFNYTINGNEVKFANGTHTISSGVVTTTLRHIPINDAMGKIDSVTNNLKIYEIMDYYEYEGKYYETYANGVYSNEVTGVMKTIAGKTIQQLTTDGIEDLKIYEVMDYYEHNGKYYETYESGAYSNEVTGVMRAIAGKTIEELARDGVDEMPISEIMGYYENGGKYYKDFDGTTYSNEVTGVMKAIAGKTIDGLSIAGAFDDVYIYDVMGYYANDGKYYKNYNGIIYSNEVTGVMAEIAGMTIGEMSENGAFDDIYVYDVMGYYENDGKYYENFDGTTYSNEVTGVMKLIAECTIGGLNTKLEQLTLGEALDVTESDATGVIKAFYSTPINQLASKIENIKIYEALGYYEHDGKYYETFDGTNYSDQVTGLIATLAGFSVDKLSNPSTFNGVYIYEVMGYYENGGKYYKNFDGINYSNEVTGVMKSIAGKTIEQLGSTDSGIDTLTLGEVLDIEYSTATGVIKTFYNTPINALADQIKNIKVYEAMGYYYDEANDKYYQNYDEKNETYSNEVELTGIMKAIANLEVNKLNTEIDKVKAKDVFDVESTPILKLFIKDYGTADEDRTELNNLTIMNMPNEVITKLNSNDVTIGLLIDIGIIDREDIAEDAPVRLLTISELIDLALTY